MSNRRSARGKSVRTPAGGHRLSFASGLACALAVLIIPVTCCADAFFQLDRVTPRAMYLQPGTSGSYILRITNSGDAPGIAPLYATLWYENRHDPTPYTLEQSDDLRCGPLHVDAPYPGSSEYGPAFETASIAPGTSLECDIKVVRPAASGRDTSLQWSIRDTHPPYAVTSGEAFIGTLADTSFNSRTLEFSIDADGMAQSLVEVSVHNGSRVATAPSGAGTCMPPFPPFAIDASFDGGCPSHGVLCPGPSYGIGIPQLGPDQTYTCRVKLRSIQSYTEPLNYPLMLDLQRSAGGGTLMNINMDGSTLMLGPLATVATEAVPANRLLHILVLLLLVMGGARLSRTSRA